MPITLRPVRAWDFDAWLALWRGYQAFYSVNIAAGVTQETWRRLMDPAEAMFSGLAFQDETAVGMVNFLTHRSTWTTGDYCYLQDLFVAPQARGLGIGRALIEHVYAYAASAGCARVYWLTHERNATARRLYDQVAEWPGLIQYRRLLPL
jgi:GNAT superfamily N-acetyltransferase